MRNFKNLLLLFAITLITNSCSDLPRIIKLTWGDIEYVNQTTLIVTDTLVDINVDVTEFGHIWSETNPNLEYGNTGITTISSSSSPSDNGFSSIQD